MKLEISKEEQQHLMAALDVAVKSAQNSLQTASILLPLAQRISDLKEKDKKVVDVEVDN